MALLLTAATWGVQAQEVLTLPASADVESSRHLVVHGALDLPQITPVLEAFHLRHPELAITYRNLTTLDLHRRFLAAPDEPDVLLSSAMPWQYQLANAGHARELESAEADAWPDWARWRRELFAFTFEPIVMVMRRELVARFGEITSHTDLLALLTRHSDALRGRVVTYDPARSGAGYTYAIEESQLSPRYWDLVTALGSVDADLAATTAEMLAGLGEGRYLLGYNLLGSYARDAVAADPDLVMVVPDDYALVISRLAFVPRRAPNPDAARRFLDFLISEAGQRVLATQTALGAIHPALDGPGTASAMRVARGDALRPVSLGPGLLATLDDLKRRALLARWRREFTRRQPSDLTARP